MDWLAGAWAYFLDDGWRVFLATIFVVAFYRFCWWVIHRGPRREEEGEAKPQRTVVSGKPILIILGDPRLVPMFRSQFPGTQVVSVADPGWHPAKLGLNDVLVLYRQDEERLRREDA